MVNETWTVLWNVWFYWSHVTDQRCKWMIVGYHRLTPSRCWYSFTDLVGMESWVSFSGKEGYTTIQIKSSYSLCVFKEATSKRIADWLGCVSIITCFVLSNLGSTLLLHKGNKIKMEIRFNDDDEIQYMGIYISWDI